MQYTGNNLKEIQDFLSGKYIVEQLPDEKLKVTHPSWTFGLECHKDWHITLTKDGFVRIRNEEQNA